MVRGERTHYDVLGVPSSASHAQIKAAFRELALISHPDKGGTEEDFQSVQIAWEVLSGSLTRAAYDAKLAAGTRSEQPSSADSPVVFTVVSRIDTVAGSDGAGPFYHCRCGDTVELNESGVIVSCTSCSLNYYLESTTSS